MVRLDEKVLHKNCLRCAHCKSVLSAGKYAAIGGKYYCKPHFKQLFALKGNYTSGFADGDAEPPKQWTPRHQDGSARRPSDASRRPFEQQHQQEEGMRKSSSQYESFSHSSSQQDGLRHSPSRQEELKQESHHGSRQDDLKQSPSRHEELRQGSHHGSSTDVRGKVDSRQASSHDVRGGDNEMSAVSKVSDRVADSIERLRTTSRDNLPSTRERSRSISNEPRSSGRISDRYQPQVESNARSYTPRSNNMPSMAEAKSRFASLGGGNSNKCTQCDKTVYPVEQTTVESKVFHKTCFKCAHCHNTLKLGNYAALDGKYYCKPHFKQLFALKGNYNEGFGTEQHKSKWQNKEESVMN